MDLKMISNDLRSSCRALLIGAYQSGGGGNSGEWTYPESWLSLPEPDNMGANFIISTQNPIRTSFNASFNFSASDVEINWGDGTIDTVTVVPNSNINHTYESCTGHMAGDFEQFLIQMRFLNFQANSPDEKPQIITADYNTQLQAIKVGNGVKMAPIQYPYLCKYIKYGDPELDITKSEVPNIERFEYTGSPITEIPENAFKDFETLTDENLTGIDFSEITLFGGRTFEDCHSLFKHGLNAPKCARIDFYAFQYCRLIPFVNLPSGCVIDNTAFQYCYSLYDNPAYQTQA